MKHAFTVTTFPKWSRKNFTKAGIVISRERLGQGRVRGRGRGTGRETRSVGRVWVITSTYSLAKACFMFCNFKYNLASVNRDYWGGAQLSKNGHEIRNSRTAREREGKDGYAEGGTGTGTGHHFNNL